MTAPDVVILTEPIGPGQPFTCRGVVVDGREFPIPSDSTVSVTTSDTKVTTVTLTLYVSQVEFKEVQSASREPAS